MATIKSFTNGTGGFGQAALEKARASGLSDAQIKQQVAAAGLTLGASAAQSLGAKSSSTGGGGSGSGGGGGVSAANAPFQATAGLDIKQFAGTGGSFGLAAMQRAQQAGLSGDQVKARLAGSGLTIGAEVQKQLGIGANGYPGGIATSNVDAGSGASYKTRGIATNTHGVVYASGPMTAEQVRSFLAGEPEENWVLPASTAGPGQPYQAPSGTKAVSPVSVDLAKRINPSAYQQPAQQEQGAQATPSNPAQSYQQSFDAASSSYQKTIDELNTKLKTAEADRDAAANDARLYREEAIDTQLAGLRSGGSSGGRRIGGGSGSLLSGGGGYSSSRSRSLVDVRAGLDATDSVLSRKTPVVTPLSSGRRASAPAPAQAGSSSGGSAAGYYSRRFS